MATYTTQIRTIVESGHPLFDYSYPIWEESYREVLEKKIIDRYYFREIGFETVGMFKHFLRERLNTIMPRYNEMYQAKVEYLKQNAYTNKDIKTTRLQITDTETEQATSSSNSVESETTGNDTNIGKTVEHDTPMDSMGTLDTNYASKIITNNDDVTNRQMGETTENGSGSLELTGKTVDDVLEHVIGFDGMKYAFEVYQGVRENILNIDELILKELKDLFMGVY